MVLFSGKDITLSCDEYLATGSISKNEFEKEEDCYASQDTSGY